MPQNQNYQLENTTPQNPAQTPQVPTAYNMPQQSPVQNILSGWMGQPRSPNSWPGFGGPQADSLRGTPEYVPMDSHYRGTPQMGAPAQVPPGTPQAPLAPNPQYPGASGQITGQQPVPPPSTQPDMNSVMNNLVTGASQNLGGAQAQPQIHPAIQQFQGMLQGIQNNPQMLQALFGAMPGGLQGFMSMIQPLLGAMTQAPQGQIKEGSALIGSGQKGSQGALGLLRNIYGQKPTPIKDGSATIGPGPKPTMGSIMPATLGPGSTTQIRAL